MLYIDSLVYESDRHIAMLYIDFPYISHQVCVGEFWRHLLTEPLTFRNTFVICKEHSNIMSHHETCYLGLLNPNLKCQYRELSTYIVHLFSSSVSVMLQGKKNL